MDPPHEKCSCLSCVKKFAPKSFICHLCDKKFRWKPSLNKHLSNVHNSYTVRKNLLCPVKVCSYAAARYPSLRDHITQNHSKLHDEETLHFQNFADFEIWKKKEEAATQSSFIRGTADQKLKHFRRKYYYCYRSGIFKSEGKGIRAMKAQGSFKIGATCPATLNVDILSNGEVTARYCKSHFGHENVNLYLVKKKDKPSHKKSARVKHFVSKKKKSLPNKADLTEPTEQKETPFKLSFSESDEESIIIEVEPDHTYC